jgi:hypothetical protein
VALFANDRALGPDAAPTEGRMLTLWNGDDRLTDAVDKLSDVDVVRVGSAPVTVGGTPGNVVVAGCADIAGMYVLAAGQSCVDGLVYALNDGFSHGPGSPGDGPVVTPAGVPLPAPVGTLDVQPRWGVSQGGVLLVTRTAPAASLLEVAYTSTDVVVPDLATADRALRVVSAASPTAVLEGDLGTRQGYDTDLLVTLLVAGLAVSFALGVGAFAAAAVDRTMERRRDNATLAVVGVSRRTATLGEVAFGGLPLVMGLATATVATLVTAASLGAVLEAPMSVVFDRVSPVLWMAAAALVVGLALIAAPAWLTQRITAEHLRRP